MKRTFIYAIAGAVGMVGMAETMPQASAAENAAPRSLEQVRAQVRSEAMTSLANGQIETVGRRWRGGGRNYGGRRYYGGRGYYGGRRYYGGRGYYGGRRYYGPRRYYYGRRYRPGIYFGIY